MRTFIASYLVVMLAACGQAESPPPEVAPSGSATMAGAPAFRNVTGEVDFVGDAACADCHEDLWRGYQSHGMAQSYYPLTPEHTVERVDGTVVLDTTSGLRYRVVERDGKLFQEEYREGEGGATTHRLVREMQFVVGSGTAARTYLTRNEGRLYELPLTWYTQAGRWDFSPGYDVSNGRFERLIPDRCMACHNSFPEAVPFAEGKYREVPHGIGCERCHGPGALHVEARLADTEPPGEIDDTIVNPKHLPIDLRLDVCQQCHLHGSVSLLREGRGPFDFLPSQPLAAHEALFSVEERSSEEQIDVISHADRMKRSPCFTATQGTPRAMDCTTCHDPHEGFRTKGADYFNVTCRGCHPMDALQAAFASESARETHRAAANCFACHMPKTEAEDAPHASFTDHWIRVVEEAAVVTTPAPAHAVTLTPYFERDKTGKDGQIYEGMAYVVYGRQQNDREAMERGVTLLASALPDAEGHGEAHFLLGLARMQLGQNDAAISALEEAVRLDPGIPERLNALAQAYEAARRDPTRIARLYERALQIQPALAEVRVNYGRFLEAQGRLAEALVEYQRAANEQPWLAVAHFNLGTAYLRQGDPAKAETALTEAVRLRPDYAEARGNLGLLYASRGEKAKAHAQFEAAVEAAPQSAVALGNLGTYYLHEDDLPRAVDLLTRAVEADSQYVDGLINLALAHLRLDDPVQSRKYATQALQLNPNHPTARQILAAL